MTRRVTLALILALCALFAGCGEQEKPQENSAIPDAVVQKPAVPDSGLRIAAMENLPEVKEKGSRRVKILGRSAI